MDKKWLKWLKKGLFCNVGTIFPMLMDEPSKLLQKSGLG